MSSENLSRKERLKKLINCPIVGRTYKYLNKDERQIVNDFVEVHENTKKDDYAYIVNRLFLDKSDKPEHHNDMWAVLINLV